MELRDTVKEMLSEDYKERFRAEYHQAKIRADKLAGMLAEWINGEVDFDPTCSAELLISQQRIMERYVMLLEARAMTEGITL